ncbi:hypothetical protein Q5752_002608 [Cryptotrichosporon argae]
MDPVGLGIDQVTDDYPSDAEEPHWTPGTSSVAAIDDDEEALAAADNDDDEFDEAGDDGEDARDGDGDDTYPESTSSSDECDPDIDPALFAARLDGLAGMHEVGEAEARALRWGPATGRERNAPDLSIPEFKALLMHHLDATDWMYDAPPGEQQLERVFGLTWAMRGLSGPSATAAVDGMEQSMTTPVMR